MKFGMGQLLGPRKHREHERLQLLELATAEQSERLRALEGSIRESEVQTQKESGRYSGVLRHPSELISLLTLLSLLMYGAAWIMVRNFYNVFSVKPDEVGITYGVLLPRIATFIGFLFVVYAAVALYWSWTIASNVVDPDGRPLHLRKRLWQTALAIVLAPLLYVLVILIFGYFNSVGLVVYWGSVTISIALIWSRHIARGLQLVAPRKNDRQVVSTLAVLLIVVASLWSLARVATNAANSIHDNQGMGRRIGTYLDAALGIRVNRVAVQWVQGQAPPGLPDVAYYLGQSDEVMVLYEDSTGRVYRLSAQNVMLSHV
jgi:hypothetical protein